MDWILVFIYGPAWIASVCILVWVYGEAKQRRRFRQFMDENTRRDECIAELRREISALKRTNVRPTQPQPTIEELQSLLAEYEAAGCHAHPAEVDRLADKLSEMEAERDNDV
jgi:polyhydroxyalkanoate synthesis regulator phasin